jgi:hypothetical protein
MFDIKLSPSKLAYYEACPMFWQDQTDTKSEAAEEGDRLHEAVEKQDVSLLDDPEQKEAVKQCIDYVRQLAPKPYPKSGIVVGQIGYYDQVREEVWLESDIGKRGRADLLIFPAADRKSAHLVDYKFGKAPVEHARTNAQGVDYAYRVFRAHPDVDRVTVHFLMPRQRDVTWHTFERERDFLGMRERILKVHNSVNDPFKQPTPNLEKACQYCDLKAQCPALAGTAVQVARRVNLLPMPEDFAPHAPRTPEERGMAQELADLLIKWAEEVKQQNTKAVLEGADADGFRVQTRKGNTSVQNSLEFARALCDKYELALEDVVEKAGTVSFSKSIEMLKQYNPDLDAVEIRSKLEKDMGHLIKLAPQISFLARERKGKKKETKILEETNRESNKQLLEQVAQAKQTIGE